MNVSPSVRTGISIGKPPACQMPRLTSSARSRKCVWHGFASLQVFRMAMTGLPVMSSQAEPRLLRARAMAERSEIVLAEPAVAAQLRAADVRGRLMLIARRARGRPGRAGQLRRRRAARRTAGSGPVDAMPASSVAWCSTRAGPPGVAQVLERHERSRESPRPRSQRCACAGGQQGAARLPARCSPEPVVNPSRPIVAQVNDGRALAHAADRRGPDRRGAAGRRGTRSLSRIVPDDGVLDRDADAVVHQPADGIEAGVARRSRSRPPTSGRG